MISLRPYQDEAIAALPSRVENIAGRRSGKLTVLSFAGVGGKRKGAIWLCRCDCGRTKEIAAENIKRGKAKSCGCASNEFRSKSLTVHGQSRTKGGKPSGAWASWNAMISRCTQPSNGQYHDYGGRGISVCERWSNFENFYSDMGDRPEGMSLDRIDPNGNYGPANCRWSTPKEQTANRRPSIRNHEFRLLLKAAQRVIQSDESELKKAIADLSQLVASLEKGRLL
jgi:hypothetical protein